VKALGAKIAMACTNLLGVEINYKAIAICEGFKFVKIYAWGVSNKAHNLKGIALVKDTTYSKGNKNYT